MKYLLILLCFWGHGLFAQEHLSNTWSFSGGKALNSKGGNVGVHYHLNSFDEFRFNAHTIQEPYLSIPDNQQLTLNTTSVHLDFARGFKFKELKKVTAFTGAGFVWGKEKIERDTIAKNLFGLSMFQELEVAPFSQFSLFGRLKMIFPFSGGNGKWIRWSIGIRFYP